VAAGAEALFSVRPDGDRWAKLQVAGLPFKLQVELSAFVILVLLNLRGVKESVKTLTPIFLVFIATHAIVIAAGIGLHLGRAHEVATEISTVLHRGLSTMGFGGLALLFLRRYSLVGGPYRAAEAAANGLQAMGGPGWTAA